MNRTLIPFHSFRYCAHSWREEKRVRKKEGGTSKNGWKRVEKHVKYRENDVWKKHVNRRNKRKKKNRKYKYPTIRGKGL